MYYDHNTCIMSLKGSAKGLEGTQPPNGVSKQKNIYLFASVQHLKILRISSDALNGFPAPDKGRVAQATNTVLKLFNGWNTVSVVLTLNWVNVGFA